MCKRRIMASFLVTIKSKVLGTMDFLSVVIFINFSFPQWIPPAGHPCTPRLIIMKITMQFKLMQCRLLNTAVPVFEDEEITIPQKRRRWNVPCIIFLAHYHGMQHGAVGTREHKVRGQTPWNHYPMPEQYSSTEGCHYQVSRTACVCIAGVLPTNVRSRWCRHGMLGVAGIASVFSWPLAEYSDYHIQNYHHPRPRNSNGHSILFSPCRIVCSLTKAKQVPR